MKLVVLVLAAGVLVYALVGLVRHRPEDGRRWDRARLELLGMALIGIVVGVRILLDTPAGHAIGTTCVVAAIALFIVAEKRRFEMSVRARQPMKIDLFHLREEARATLTELARYCAVPVADLQEWERSGSVPSEAVVQVNWGVWAMKRDAALARSGLPECAWIKGFEAESRHLDPESLYIHAQGCTICTARSTYVDEHVGPMPPPNGMIARRPMAPIPPLRAGIARRLYIVSRKLSAWQRSALTGAAVIVCLGAPGVLSLVVLGIVRSDFAYILTAAGLFFALALSGAGGGSVYYATRGLRDRSTIGFYASAILTAYAYLFLALALTLLTVALIHWRVPDGDVRSILSSISTWVFLLVGGGLFGMLFGRVMRGTVSR